MFLSVENEGLERRIETLKNALSSLRKRLDSSNRKLKELSREHSKCPEKKKIIFLYR
jgi:flagellar biosynthesis chaperone FliJ